MHVREQIIEIFDTANKTTTSEIITVNHTISAVHSEAMKKITKEKMKAMEK
jgi:hypothetical protein